VTQVGAAVGTGASGGRVAAALAALVLLTAWTPDPLRIEKSHYTIHATSRADLLNAVRRSGPRAGTAYGLATIDFHPRIRTERSGTKCRIVSVKVGLSIWMRLPRWDRTRKAPATVSRVALAFERAVEAHEMQHVAIARAHARNMERRLSTLSSDPSCWRLRARADRLIAELKRAHAVAQRRFDDRTRRQIKRLL
jgi:predicted secreted Zn-dependent protease